jgi:hypothetical protein
MNLYKTVLSRVLDREDLDSIILNLALLNSRFLSKTLVSPSPSNLVLLCGGDGVGGEGGGQGEGEGEGSEQGPHYSQKKNQGSDLENNDAPDLEQDEDSREPSLIKVQSHAQDHAFIIGVPPAPPTRFKAPQSIFTIVFGLSMAVTGFAIASLLYHNSKHDDNNAGEDETDVN